MTSELQQSSSSILPTASDGEDSAEAILVILKRIDSKLDSLIDDLEDFAEKEDEDGEDLPSTESDEDVKPKKKKAKLTSTPSQLYPYGYNREKTFGGFTGSGFLPKRPPYQRRLFAPYGGPPPFVSSPFAKQY